MEYCQTLLLNSQNQLVENFREFTLYSALKVIGVVLLVANLKNFPLVYHLRILNGIRFVLKSQRPKVKLTPSNLFQPLITSSRAPLMEIDVFGHKSNSTYFADIDIARAHFVSTVFSEAIESLRGSTTMNGLSGKPQSAFTMPLGAVSCSFRKEIKPYEAYDMWTRILSWDEKWVYLVTHFVKQSSNIEPKSHWLYPQQDSSCSDTISTKTAAPSSDSVAASALSKVVFKDGRRTIPPRLMFELAGLYPKCECTEGVDSKCMEYLDQDTGSSSDDSGYDSISKRSGTCDNVKVLHTIERERRRGLKVASLLGEQTALSEEFRSEECLGRHYDGVGVEGVMSTLAQLGKFSRYQLI